MPFSLRMKRDIKGFSACLIILLFSILNLTACSEEDIISDSDLPDTPIEYSGEKVKKYFSFTLSLVNGVPSRADDSYVFEDGDQDSESKVSNLLIFFYDQKGTCVGFFDSESFDQDKVEETGVEEIGWNTLITVPVDVYEEIKDTAIDSFFAIVNYDASIRGKYISEEKGSDGNTIYKLKSRSEIQNFTLPSWKVEGKGFVMTTPGHFDTLGNYLNYWKISEDGSTKKGSQIIYETKSAAASHPVSVYVERLAAKIELSKIGNIDGIEVLYGTDVYELVFTPTAWGLEAEENTEYISKLSSSKTAYENITNYPSGFYDWINFTDSHRTFWAESPTFSNNSNKYPATGSETLTNLSLKYTSLKAINLNADDFKEEKYEGFTYALEHTFPASELQNKDNPYAVPTSFVLKGRYTGAIWKRTDQRKGEAINHDGTEIPGNQVTTKGQNLSFENSGFYLRDIDMERTDKEADETGSEENSTSKRYQYRLYREDNGATTGPKDDLYIALTKEQHVIFVKSIETYSIVDSEGNIQTGQTEKYLPVKESTTYSRVENGANETYTLKAEDIFNIINTNQYWNGISWIKAPNTFTLQFKDTFTPSNSPELYYAVYDEKSGKATYTLITTSNKVMANQELQKQLGYARKYYKGMAFFYSPITHYTGDNAPFSDSNNHYKGLFNYETETKERKTGYKKDDQGRYIPYHKTGDFGVVRNHIYNFTIAGISSLGYGVPNEDVIPLPDPVLEKEIYLFDIELKILPWNLFEYTLDI